MKLLSMDAAFKEKETWIDWKKVKQEIDDAEWERGPNTNLGYRAARLGMIFRPPASEGGGAWFVPDSRVGRLPIAMYEWTFEGDEEIGFEADWCGFRVDRVLVGHDVVLYAVEYGAPPPAREFHSAEDD